MKKIIILAVVLAVIGVAAWFIFSRGNTAPNNTTDNNASTGMTGSLPAVVATTSTDNFPTGSTLTIGTPEGSVTMNNFYNNAKQISIDHTSVLITETDAYSITYYVPDSSFGILISETPVATVRAQAEAAFLQALGISQADACKLNVAIEVPQSVDPSYADENLGLSFCSGGAFQAQ